MHFVYFTLKNKLQTKASMLSFQSLELLHIVYPRNPFSGQNTNCSFRIDRNRLKTLTKFYFYLSAITVYKTQLAVSNMFYQYQKLASQKFFLFTNAGYKQISTQTGRYTIYGNGPKPIRKNGMPNGLECELHQIQ